jgi:N-acylneuraminate cytidylyltransferase
VNENILVLIPARCGSKGLPDKNILLLNNKPLIHYTIDVAREVFDDDIIRVSTDCKKIKSIAEKTGLKVGSLRPRNLAKDNTSSYDVITYEINNYEKTHGKLDAVVLLQPTSPFRKSEHIKECLKLYHDNLDMIVSVKTTKSNPYFNLFEENKYGYLNKVKKSNFNRRQDCPNVWEYNGSIYIMNVKSLKKMNLNDFKKIKKYEMDDYHSVDIDNEIDYKLCKVLLDKNDFKVEY